MGILFQNKEYKVSLFKIIILQIVSIFLMFNFFNIKFDKLNKSIIRENTAIAGKIMINYPEMEEEIVKIILKTPSKIEYKTGKEILEKYSYNENIDKYSNLVLKDFIYRFNLESIILNLMPFIGIIILLSLDYRKMYLDLKKFSNTLEKITSGIFETDLKDDKEGELSILSHNINLLAYRYKSTVLSLNDEKIFLKNIVSDISHQLKTPLSSLIIINEIMLNNKKMEEEDKESFLNKTKLQLERMEWLVLSLLKYARIEAGVIVLKKEKVLFENFLKSIISELEIYIKEKNIEIDFQGNMKESIFCDFNWFKEALINIVKNALEHSNEGSKIIIKLEKNNLFTRIYIEDFGEGIKKKNLPYIFDRFKKFSNELKPNSIGIGLSLSKTIIKKLDGDIYAKSTYKKGTKFIITFLKY